MATCRQLQQDYNRLGNWFATHDSLKGTPEYDGAIDQEIKIIKDAQKKRCAWINAMTARRAVKKPGGGPKKGASRRRTRKPK